MNNLISSFFRDEEGIQTLEMVIILVVLVSIAFAFRRTLATWYNDIVNQTTSVNTTTPTPAEPGLGGSK